MIKSVDFSNFYVTYKEALGTSLIISFIMVSIFYFYLSNYKNFVRQVCWIEYQESNESTKTKYYIFYASDNKYVVCGTTDRFEDNQVYKYIKIDEIKEKYLLNYAKISSASSKY